MGRKKPAGGWPDNTLHIRRSELSKLETLSTLTGEKPNHLVMRLIREEYGAKCVVARRNTTGASNE